MFYPRHIFSQIREHLEKPEVTVITGMRRTGKTAILNELYLQVPDNKVFLDLENRANHEPFLLTDYDLVWERLQNAYGLLSKSKSYIFLDEIQNLPILPKVLKYLSDHYPIKFVVSGSSSFYLKNLFSESLSGRKQIFELFPVTFEEFLVFKGKRKALLPLAKFDPFELSKSESDREIYGPYFEEYLKFGGFPGVVLRSNEEEKLTALKDILYSYLDEDVQRLADFSKMEALEKLARLLPARIGQKIEVARISAETGLARQTVGEYLEFLEKTYFISRIGPFTASVGREISKTKKLYFCDSGLANLISPVSEGQALENAIYNAFRVKSKFERAFGQICYFQKSGGPEIDFVLDGKSAVEVKVAASNFDVRGLRREAEKLKIKKTLVVCKNSTPAKNVVYAVQI